jgi:F-type H+-transporting ATPase subunit alpha
MSTAAMAFSLYAVNEGMMDDVPVKKIVAFEAAMQAYLKSHSADLINQINETADFNDDIAAAMRKAIEAFKTNGAW